MIHMCYYTRGNIIIFTISEENHYMIKQIVSGSDTKQNLAEIIERYSVRSIERID